MAAELVVIIPAAGTGSRFGGPLPKQFVALAGQPLILHVIERFLVEESVSHVIVPVPEMLLSQMKSTARVTFVAGGETRQQSVIRGVAEAGDAELIAVHDAARPLFSPAILHAVLHGAREVGAALPVIPVADTIHVMNNDATVAQTLDRAMLGAAQTPQIFRTEILRDVLTRAQAEGIEGTDEAGLAVRFGYTVRGVPGDPRNLKITVPEDLEIAESYLKQWSET
jgi:2-C-methyl-D-erythritol 4-phosphate cytidylyltransferase